MNWLQSLLYGFVSGITGFLPVSSQAHQAILLHLFGAEDNGLLRLFIHTALLTAVMVGYRPQMTRLYREIRLAQLPRKRRRRSPDVYALMEVSLLKTGGWVLMLTFLLYPPAASMNYSLNYVALFLLLNGAIVYIPQLLSTGNKDARTMSRLDAALIGFGGALGMLPGISSMGALTSVYSIRGADREKALTWSCFLMLPVLACLMGFDIQAMITNGVGSFGFGDLIVYLFTAAATYLGASVSISIMRSLAVNAGYSGFAFYSWGAALFAFILYLTN